MKRIFRTSTVASLLIGASAIAVSVPALAQDAAADAPAQSEAQLDEIVVTAQKREQNLQDVPLAISALSAAKVETLGIKDSRDLSGLAPNVTITQGTTSNNAAVISIRGIPTPASETFGLDTANGVYVDGVYIGRAGASAIDVTDIARVEVLRGPQGTLFGRNTTGGGIAFISRAPSRDFKLKAEGGYGNFNAWNGRISLDPGEIAGIATSFSYSHRERHGVVDNINEPDDARDPGARKSDAARFAAKAEIGGTGSVQYIFDWSKTNGSPNNLQLTNTSNGALRTPILIGNEELNIVQPAPVSRYLENVTFADPACAALSTPTRVWQKKVCNDITSRSMDETWGHNLQVENDFGPFSVKSTTGYRNWNNDSVTDLDGLGAFTGPKLSTDPTDTMSPFYAFPASVLTAYNANFGFYNQQLGKSTADYLASQDVLQIQQNLYDTSNKRRHKQFSQEVEFSGKSDSFDWVVGGFYFWEKGSEVNPQNNGFVYDTNTGVFTDAKFGPNAYLLRENNPEQYRLVQVQSVLHYSATSESKAVYGQTTFYPGGRDSGLRLTAGGRYTWDTKSMTRYQNGASPYATPQRGDAKFSKFTWNLMVGYDVADGINTYARVATGYRSGGFNAQDAAVGGALQSFKPESVTSYEAGVKTELFDRRVRFNLSGYYNEYKDLAVNVPLLDAEPGTYKTRVLNAGKVTYTGVEAELQAVLTDNFTFEGNIGYVDVKYKEFIAGQQLDGGAELLNVASISVPGYTSPLTANAALNAQFPVGAGDMRLTGRVSYTYEDPKYNFNNAIASPFHEAIRTDARNNVDAQIGLEGIAVGGGEGWVRLWVKNLTNEHIFTRGIDFAQLGYAGGYYADPRTYGVTAGIKF